MGKTMLGIVLGAVIYFAAGALSWTVMPWMDHGMKKLPEEMLVRDTLKVVVKEPAVYCFPSDKTETGRMEDKAFAELFKSGPVGLIFIRMAGSEMMTSMNFVISGIEALVTAAFAMALLILTRPRISSFGARWLLIVGLGVFIWFNSLIPFWNWFNFPSNFVGSILLDTLFSFGLLGLVLPKFVPADIRSL